MKKLSFFLSLFVLLLLNACTTQKIFNPMSSMFKNNVKKEYYTGGKIRSKLIMSDKTGQNGLLKKYGYTAKLTSTVTIRNGVKHGIQTMFDKKGRVIKKTPYRNGRKEGVVQAFYPNGVLMAEITYVNNVREGRAAKYNIDGSLNQQAMFKNGHISD